MSETNEQNDMAAAVKRISEGVASFAEDMRRQGIHVGMGAKPLTRCVNCGEPWPCAGSGSS